jgi:hypothetical protein
MMRREGVDPFARWYVAGVAALYVCLCSVSTIRYLYLDLRVPDVYIPLPVQIVCFLAAASGIVYFFKPRVGHHALLLVAILGLCLTASDHHAGAVVFHLLVLGLLSIPLIEKFLRSRTTQAGGE